jgi:hypothetical protein
MDIDGIEMVDLSNMWDRCVDMSAEADTSLSRSRGTVINHINTFLKSCGKEEFDAISPNELNMTFLGKLSHWLIEVAKVPAYNSYLSYISEAKELMVMKKGSEFNLSKFRSIKKMAKKRYIELAKENDTVLMKSASGVTDQHAQFIGDCLFLNYGGRNPERMHLFRALIMLDRQLVGRISEAMKSKISLMIWNQKTERFTVSVLPYCCV